MADLAFLLAGLGNPGAKYERTRHNIGFRVIDRLAREWGGATREKKWKAEWGRLSFTRPRGDALDLILLKPQNFMNNSGESVGPAAKFFQIPPERWLVLHDECELPFAEMRFKQGGGHKGHNGLRDIIEVGGSPDFFRLRLGVGRPEGRNLADYLLAPFSQDEEAHMDDYLARAAALVRQWLEER